MTSLFATVRLRPTRIALLVRPKDLVSIRRFMRICACLWGGIYNPIVPVFRTPPREWRSKHAERVKGYAITRGYVEYFEPDAYVEAESGLLEEAGLGALRAKHDLRRRVIALSDFLRRLDQRDWSEPHFGLSIIDVLRHIYAKERRFELREQRPAFLVSPQRGDALVEAIFGAYPADKLARYIGKGFADVYRPESLIANADAWRKVFRSGGETPLRLTRFGLETKSSRTYDLVVFVFDPGKPTDIIDFWNMRIESSPVLPVPLPWLTELGEDIRKTLTGMHRTPKGSPGGIMARSTVEFARSIDEANVNAALELLNPLPNGALSVKRFRTQVWVHHADDFVHRDSRIEVAANERHLSLDVEEGEPQTTKFETLAPEFVSPYGYSDLRWVNTVIAASYGPSNIATVIPFNTFDWDWPRLNPLGDRVIVGAEGWAFAQQHSGSTQTIQLHTHESIIIDTLKRAGIDAKHSEPGRIAKQVLGYLGNLPSVHLLADKETLRLLNSMAGGIRRRFNEHTETEEAFDRRSKPLKEWQDLIARRNQAESRPRVTLEDFTRRNIIRLGIETACPHCQATNWHSLTVADYQLACERCLKAYPFPQADLRPQNKNWVYRVIGPFSVPDYARGSYASLLALNVLDSFYAAQNTKTIRSTALALRFGGIDAEVDFAALQARGRVGLNRQPDLIIGEAKSLGDGDLIKMKDLNKLRAIAARLPGSVIVIAVMRDAFTVGEKRLLIPFVKWARRPNIAGEPTYSVLLLTGTELFHRFDVSLTWQKLGGKHAAHSDHHFLRNLKAFAEATQAVYLGLPSHHEELRNTWQKRRARKDVAAAPQPRGNSSLEAGSPE